MKSHKSIQLVTLCLLLLAAATGCTSGKSKGWQFAKKLDVRKAVGLKKDEALPIEMPTRLVSTWSDTVLNREGQAPQRGFGGRLMFFNDESEDTVRVDGQLVVYAYDDSNRPEHETHPTRRYIFPREQFARHESDSKVGPSYSFWLPWDEVGGEQKDIGLIARFEPHQGPRIVGEQTRHLLPGTTQLASGKKLPPAKQIGEIRLAEYSRESGVALPSVQPTAGEQPLKKEQTRSTEVTSDLAQQQLAATAAICSKHYV